MVAAALQCNGGFTSLSPVLALLGIDMHEPRQCLLNRSTNRDRDKPGEKNNVASKNASNSYSAYLPAGKFHDKRPTFHYFMILLKIGWYFRKLVLVQKTPVQYIYTMCDSEERWPNYSLGHFAEGGSRCK